MRFFSGLITAILILAASVSTVKAQEDKIYLHSGQTIVGEVLGVDSKEVNFVYLKMEKVKCARFAVEKIVYKDGKIEVISPKIVVASKDDWEKVRLLLPDEDISGLKYQGFVGDIRKPVTPEMLEDKEAVKKLKEEAASRGFPFVQISPKKNIAYTYN